MVQKALFVLFLPVACIMALHIHGVNSKTYYVVPDAGSSGDSDDEVYSLMDALSNAKAGDTIDLGDGIYTDAHYTSGRGG